MLRDFLVKLRARGITLWLQEGALKFKAKSVSPLTPQDKAFLREHKADVMDFLQQNADFFDYFPLTENQKSLWLVYQADPKSVAYNLAHTVKLAPSIHAQGLQRAFHTLCQRHAILRTAYSDQQGESVQRVLADYTPEFVCCETQELSSEALVSLSGSEADIPFCLEKGEVCRAKLWINQVAVDASFQPKAQYAATGSLSNLENPQLTNAPTQALIFQLTLHHIAADFWSCEVLFDELLDIYQQQENQATNAHFASLAPQAQPEQQDYFTWAVLQQQWRQSQAAQHAAHYWQQHLQNTPTVLALPSDKPRPAVQCYQGEMLRFDFTSAQTQAMRDTARKLSVTPFILGLAAFQVFLARYSGQTQFTLGTPTSGRLSGEYQRTIGYLVNPVVLACDCPPHAHFSDFVAQVKTQSRGALAHQQWPLSQLMTLLEVKRDPSRNPLFQHLFALTPVQKQKNAELIETTYLSEQRGAALDLSVILLDDRLTFRGEWRYNTDLFSRQTALNMIDSYKAILAAVCARPNTRIGDVPLLSSLAQQQVLHNWAQGPCVDIPSALAQISGLDKVGAQPCLHQLIEAQAAYQPNATALMYENTALSYADLNAQANQLARHLHATLSLQPDARIGVCLERSIGLVVSVLAVLKAGAAFVPLDPHHPASRLNDMCQDADLRGIISLQSTQAELAQSLVSLPWICLDDTATQSQLNHLATTNIAPAQLGLTPQHLAYVIYTSGSTGKPKGVMVEHRSLVNQTVWINQAYPASASDTFLLKTPLSFDVAQSELMWSLSVGATLVIAKPEGHKDADYLIRLMQQSGITKVHFVPALLAHVLDQSKDAKQAENTIGLSCCKALKQVFCAGEALPAALVTRFYQACPQATLYNLYGPTEATIFTTYHECVRPSESQPLPLHIPIGRPINNTQLYVLDAQRQPVAKGAIGELYIAGDCLARGYLNQPELTLKSFVLAPHLAESGVIEAHQRLYKTGDLVRWLDLDNQDNRPLDLPATQTATQQETNALVYVGRVDTQIKLRGLRIELGEIEAAIARLKIPTADGLQSTEKSVGAANLITVKEVAVSVQNGPKHEQNLVAYVVLNAPLRNDAAMPLHTSALRQALATLLPEYMLPHHFVVMDALPLSANGKIDRHALPKVEISAQTAKYEAPITELEQQLCRIWQAELGVPKVGRQDNFFLLGGNSLSATRALAQLQHVIGVSVSLKTGFEHPVLAQLAQAIELQIAANSGTKETRANTEVATQTIRAQAKEGETYPLSFSQQRLWFLDRMAPGNPHYNLFFVLQYSHKLHVPNFEKAINDVVQANSILRTRYIDVDGEGRQIIGEFTPLTVPVRVLSSAESQPESLNAIFKQAANCPFDLHHAPHMLRVSLLHRQAQNDYLALFSLHHIAFDAFSNVTFLRALNTRYQAHCSGTATPLHTPAIHFADYALWQREWAQTSSYQAQFAYWQKQLEGAPAQLNLPTEFRRPKALLQQGDQVGLVLSHALSDSIRHLARISNSTLYIVMLAAFKLVLSRYSQQDDISVGTSVANRFAPETQDVMGFFVNTLVMRNRITPDSTFAAFIEQVKNTAADAYSHQDMPFDKLVEGLVQDRDDTLSPLFQVMFVLNNALDDLALELGDVDASIFATPLYHARFDLTLRVTDGALADNDSRIRCDMEFNTALYSPSFIERVLQQYQAVLQQVTENLDVPVKNLRLLSDAALQQVLALQSPSYDPLDYQTASQRRLDSSLDSAPSSETLLPNQEAAKGYVALSLPHANIAAQFEYWAAHQPDYVALRFEETCLRYGELNQHANRLAQQMLSVLQPPSDTPPSIGILMPRCAEFVVSVLAVLKAGLTYVPLDTQWPAARLQSIVDDANIGLILCAEPLGFALHQKTAFASQSHSQSASLSTINVRALLAKPEALLSAKTKPNNTPNTPYANAPAYLIYTSGSTGTPKGVVISHENVLHYLDGVVDRFQLAGQSFAMISTVAADLGNTALFGALCFGGTLTLIADETAKDADELARYLLRHPVDVLKIVPSHLQGLMAALEPEHIADILPKRSVILGGEACSLAVVKQIQAHSACRIINHYGPTETTVGALAYEYQTNRLPNDRLNSALPIGKPLLGNRVYIMDTMGQLCPMHVPGELWIAGGGVAQGYHQSDALTQARFVANPFLADDTQADESHRICYRTGDRVRWLSSGDIEFLGRMDEQVKIRGYRVEIGEVEAVLRSLQGVTQAAVTGVQNHPVAGHNQLIAYLVLSASVTLDDVKSQMQEALADYMVPAQSVVMAQLPVTANGKLDRQRLPNPNQASVEALVQAGVLNAHTFAKASDSPIEGITDAEQDGAKPHHPSEQLLVEIWRQVLRKDKVNVTDNFFDIGGDSILSLQIIARAKKAGLKITPKQLFQKKTIAALAQVATPIKSNHASALAHTPSALGHASKPTGQTGQVDASRQTHATQKEHANAPTSAFGLTPIQHWFFEAQHPQMQHWNQSVLLDAKQAVNFEALQQAVAALVKHHDALRLRFDVQTLQQQYRPDCDKDSAAKPHLATAICQRIALLDDSEDTLQHACTQLHQQLDLQQGPLLRVALFDAPKNRESACQRVFICVHHLVVDGVSWRILLGDLQQAYTQALAATDLHSLPVNLMEEKTSRYQDWVAALHTFAHCQSVQQSLAYWTQNDAHQHVAPFPVKHAKGDNRIGSVQQVSRQLSAKATHTLLRVVPSVYRTQITDILLSALAQQLGDVCASHTLLVELEGHGREEIQSDLCLANPLLYNDDTDLDLSRTVGWFTSRYPVYLHLPEANHASQAKATAGLITSIKEQLRAVPHKGLSYGVLRYLRTDLSQTQQNLLKQRQQAPISFNYLGQFDFDIAQQSCFKPSELGTGQERSAQSQRRFLIEINARIQNAQLRLDWHYSEHMFDADWIADFADTYIQTLSQLIQHITQAEKALQYGATPSDFPLAGLSASQLHALALPWHNVETLYPLTPMQEGLLFHTLMHPNSGIYFMQYRYELTGKFDHAAFVQAWQQVVQRHEVLRTAFLRQDEKALQVVYRDVPSPVNILDWRHLSAQAQQETLTQWMSEQLYRGFDLSQPTQLAITLIQTDDEKYQLIRSFHHILTDAWCFSLIMMDFLTYYHALLEGKTVTLPRPRPFEDYVAWLQAQDSEHAEAFWRNVLRGFEAPNSLGIELAMGADAKAGVADVLCHLTEAQTHKLQHAAQRQNVTLNTLVQAAWGIVLSRYSGDSDIVFGVTVAGRPTDLEGAETTVGLFINTLPLRVQVDVQTSVSDYVAQLFQTNIDMREYEFAPLVDIQRWSQVPPGEALFNSLFVFENAPIDPEMYEKLSILEVGDMTNRTHTNYPLTVVIFPQDTLGLQITYDTARFGASAIKRMLQHLRQALLNLGDRLLSDVQPEASVLDVDILTHQEHIQQLVDWNQTYTEYPKAQCWPALFAEQVQRTPTNIAVACEHQQLSYAELFVRSQQVASALRASGVKANDIIAVFDTRGIDLLVMISGILSAGAAYLPLDPKHPPKRLADIITLSQTPLVLANTGVLPTLQQAFDLLSPSLQPTAFVPALMTLAQITGNAEAGSESALSIPAQPEAAALTPVIPSFDLMQPSDLAYVIYTSGSTGVPKGAMVEHLGMLNNLYSKIPTLGLSEKDVIAQTASQCFDISVWQFLTALVCGAKVQIYPDEIVRDPQALLSAMHTHKVSILEAVPSLINSFIDERIFPLQQAPSLTHLRWLMPTGEALSSDLVKRWFARYPDIALINAYGPAECADDVAMWPIFQPSDAPADPVPIGKPTDNNRLYVMDAHQRLQPAGVMGEIYVAGAGVGRGYLNDLERTNAAFIDNPLLSHPAHSQALKTSLANPNRMYRTGDLARWRDDGVLEYLGRTDHQVKIRGFRIELGEIEACLEALQQVRYAAVVVRKDPRGADSIVAYYQAATAPTGATASNAKTEVETEVAIKQAMQQKLPDYMMPSTFVALAAMPLNANGKIDRKALPEPQFLNLEQNITHASTETEHALVPLWQQILRIQEVDIHASFFSLGGHSLLAAQLHARVCQQFEVDLPLRTLFEQNSLAQVAKHIEALKATQHLVQSVYQQDDTTASESPAHNTLEKASDAQDDMEEFEL